MENANLSTCRLLTERVQKRRMRRTQPTITAMILTCMVIQTGAAFPRNRLTRILPTPPIDWSVAVVESTIKRNPTGDSFKGWGYAKALYLYGQYLVYLRTRDKRYLDHIQSWVDQHIDEQGTINRPINSLDYIMPGNLLLILYKETKQEKYKLGAQNIRKVFDTYPRTKDGGFWHANISSRAWQLWADGVFMSLPFLARYGEMFGESKYTNDEVVKQMLIYYQHLNDPATGLLWADGVFMSLPFLARYGEMFGESKYTNDEVVKQMLIYYQHLNDPATGLLW